MRVCKHGCDVLDSRVVLRTQRFGRILESYANPRDVSGLHNCLEFSQPSLCLDEAM